jgi:AcrR family transcriptional regulator
MPPNRPDKQQLLIAAARELFEHYGYRKTSIDDVVRRAGVAKGTFYLYFRGKDELFLKVLMAIRDELLADYFERLSTIESAAEKIAFTLRFTLEAFEKHPLFARITAMDDELRVALQGVGDSEIKAETEQSLKFFKGLFEEGIARGELRADLDSEVAPIIFGSLKMMHFFKEAIAAAGVPREQFIDVLVDIGVNGIATSRIKGGRGII